MATGAVCVLVPQRQWEKVMVDSCGLPFKREDCVTLTAIRRITSLLVIGIRGSLVVFTMTIDAVCTEWVKPEIRLTGMAFEAIGHLVRTDKREGYLLMDLRDVVHDPGFRRVAPGAICTDGLLMHICMACHAFLVCPCKLQLLVAKPAVNQLVLPVKGKTSRDMIKCKGVRIELPG